MQDWAWEVADPTELNKYLTLFFEVEKNEDVRFTLADVIIQAFEELEVALESDTRWIAFLGELEKNLKVHASQVWYWAALENDIDDAWRVSRDMRLMLKQLN